MSIDKRLAFLESQGELGPIGLITKEIHALLSYAEAKGYKITAVADSPLGMTNYNSKMEYCNQIATYALNEIKQYRKVHYRNLSKAFDFVMNRVNIKEDKLPSHIDSYTTQIIGYPHLFTQLEERDLLLDNNKSYAEIRNEALEAMNYSVPLPLNSYTVRQTFRYHAGTLYEEVNAYLEQIPDAKLYDFWEQCLLNLSATNPFFIRLTNDPTALVDEHMIQMLFLCFLFAVKHLESVPAVKDSDKIDTNVFKTQMRHLAALACTYILELKETLDDLTERGVLILRVRDRHITIVEGTYKKYIGEMEGRPSDPIEFCAAHNISNLNVTISADKLIGESSVYRSKFAEMSSIRNLAQIKNSEERLRSAYIGLYDFFTAEVTQAGLKDQLRYGNVAGYTNTLNFVSKLRSEALQEVHDVIAYIYTEIILKDSPFKIFYSHVSKLRKEKPDLTPATLTGLSAVQMIVSYVFSQLSIKKGLVHGAV